ncbi:MAG: DUF1127 domain-containing protein [Acetobacteraceae bacterium]|nr:DUF1127 domain-containing protein [Acetobacteraceae bacterium]
MADMVAGSGLRLALGFRPGRWRLSLRAMLRAARTRRELAEAEDRILRDIGISRAEALAEAMRAPWDLGPPRRDG